MAEKSLSKKPKKQEEDKPSSHFNFLTRLAAATIRECKSTAGRFNIIADLVLAGFVFVAMAPDILGQIYRFIALYLLKEQIPEQQSNVIIYFFVFVFFAGACVAFMWFTLREDQAMDDRGSEE